MITTSPVERASSQSRAGFFSGHVRALDGLRGLAIVGVVGSHIFQSNFEDRGETIRLLGHFLRFGARGVDLFFVLSGFLITGILYDSLRDDGFFRKFYARRALRIFPLYYGVLLVLLMLTPWLKIRWDQVYWTLLLYLQNTQVATPIWFFQLPHGLGLNHFWSLAVEEQFYLVWPMAVFLIRSRRKLLIACALIATASLIYRLYAVAHDYGYHVIVQTTWARADSLVVGAGLALLTRGPARDKVLRAGRPVFLASSLLLVLLTALGDDTLRLSVGMSLWSIASASLIAWCLVKRSAASKVFEGDLLRWFGRYSYGIYVLHMVAAGFMLDLFRRWVQHITTQRMTVVAVAGLMLFASSTAAAFLSYHLYEKHFLRLKRFFGYRRPEMIPVAPYAGVR